MNKIYAAIGQRQDRFRLYRKLKPDLLVFPETSIAKTFGCKIIWSSELAGSEKTRFWLNLLAGKNHKIAATRTGLFLPFSKLKIIVIDDPSHPGHHESKSPQYRSYDIARKLAETHGAVLLIGMPVTNLETYYHLKKNEYKLIALPRWKMPEVVIKTPSEISDLVGNALYFVPQKGDYRGSVCKDCQALQPYPATGRCPQCGGANFRPYGIGTETLAKRLEGKIIDNNHPLDQTATINRQLSPTIATHKIFDYDLRFDTVVVEQIDHMLNLPDPLLPERLREILMKLAQICEKKLVILTRVPKHRIFTGLRDPRTFFETELKSRMKANLPPFSRLIKLISNQNLQTPQINGALAVSPIHRNIKSQYQIITHLPAEAPIAAHIFKTANWRIEPDPENLV